MQKLGLNQSLSQKLSPQQIQFIKLLQVPTAELESRIEEELEINPALEEGKEEPEESKDEEEDFSNEENSEGEDSDTSEKDDVNVDDYISEDEIGGYKMQGDGANTEEERDMPMASSISLTDTLMDQLGFLKLDEKSHAIGLQLIGSIDNDGYIRRDLDQIV